MPETDIEWTDLTWNPITGCTLVSEGCRHCYAAQLAATRLQHHPSRVGLARVNAEGVAKFTGEVRFNAQWLDQPLRWKKPRMIFVCAHGDLFHESVPDEWIDRVFAVMALCPQHVFQVLTKRPERARKYLTRPAGAGKQDVPNHLAWVSILDIANRFLPGWRSEDIHGPQRSRVIAAPAAWPLRNVWLGTSVEDQAAADARIPELLATPAAVRWISAEPLLGPVDLFKWLAPSGYFERDNPPDVGLHWVVVGGESGPHARPMHPDWARRLRGQCLAAGVPFFFKQWGAFGPYTMTVTEMPDGRVREWQPDFPGARRGKKAAGRTLDGVEHNAMPVRP